MVMYDNKLKTKENNIYTKDKIEPQFQSGEKGGVGRGGGGVANRCCCCHKKDQTVNR